MEAFVTAGYDDTRLLEVAVAVDWEEEEGETGAVSGSDFESEPGSLPSVGS